MFLVAPSPLELGRRKHLSLPSTVMLSVEYLGMGDFQEFVGAWATSCAERVWL